MPNTTLAADIRARYSFKYPSTREFIDTVANTFEHKLWAIYTPDSTDDWLAAVDMLGALGLFIEDTDPEATPDVYFGEPGYGHFKECYRLSPQYIIKFCAARNPTLQEMELLHAADEAGLAHLFLPTLFFELPCEKEPAVLEPDDDDDDHLIYNSEYHYWEHDPDYPLDHVLTHFEIQPVAEVIAPGESTDKELNAEFQCWSLSQWEEEPLRAELPTDFNPYCLRHLSGASRIWVMDFFHFYGLDALINFAAFCEEHLITDLHSSNVGHSSLGTHHRSYPIILDWLSR